MPSPPVRAQPASWPTEAKIRSNATSVRYFTAEMMGCQLYSEPGSGSDLASLSTRAERHGDDWIVNGQKVWTSGGQAADMAILLARTDPDAPKHAGLTQFVLDMHAPGVEVRPLRQMTGGAEFNEVFLTDVRVPDAERLGEINQGWSVSQHTLVLERYSMPQTPGRGEGAISVAVAAWQARPDQSSAAALALRAELMRHWVDAEVVRLLQLRAGVLRSQGSSGARGLAREAGGFHGRAQAGGVGSGVARGWRRRCSRRATAVRGAAVCAGAPARPRWRASEVRAWPSPAAPTRFSATSSATGFSGCLASRRSTGACPGVRPCATERPGSLVGIAVIRRPFPCSRWIRPVRPPGL